ncbi:hypothetical protein J6S88_06945 [bacterium]|nr:hypothetical protein [bacterium]
MYYDELFEKALKEAKEDNFTQLKDEVKTLRDKLDLFLTKFFESTTGRAENDYHLTAV